MAGGTDWGVIVPFCTLNNSTTPVGTTQKNMIPSHPHTTQKYQEVQGTPTVPLCEPRNRPGTATKEGGGVGKMGFRAIPPPPANQFSSRPDTPVAWSRQGCLCVSVRVCVYVFTKGAITERQWLGCLTNGN